MVQIGNEAQEASKKGAAQVNTTMKQLAGEFIPCGEELASVIDPGTFNLDEWKSWAEIVSY